MKIYCWPTDLDHATDEDLLFLGKDNLKALASRENQSQDSIDFLIQHMFSSGEQLCQNWQDPRIKDLGEKAIIEMRQRLEILPLKCTDTSRRWQQRLQALSAQAEPKPLHPSLRTDHFARRGTEIMVCGLIFQIYEDNSDYELFYRAPDWEEARVPHLTARLRRLVNEHGVPKTEALIRLKDDDHGRVFSLDQRCYTIMRKSDYCYLQQHPEFVPVYCSYGLYSPKEADQAAHAIAVSHLSSFA